VGQSVRRYGLAGIVYEVTFKVKPLEIISFDYTVHDVPDLTDAIVKKAISSNQTSCCGRLATTS
jgi:hypothetical protein